MRGWKWSIGIIVCLALMWGISKIWQNLLIKQFERELLHLRQKGEPTTFADLFPSIPNHQDGTLFYQLAIVQLDMVQRQLPRNLWEIIYDFTNPKPIKPLDPADVQKVLQASQPALRTLQRALNFRHMRMTDWSVENPMAVEFPHFSKFREFARILAAEGKWQKQKGDIDKAVETQMTILKLVRRMGDEPSLIIGFMLQSGLYAIAINGLEQFLANDDASPKTYRALMAELNSWDINRDFVLALQSERVLAIATCEWMKERVSKKMLRKLVAGDQPFRVNLVISLKPKNALIAQNALTMLEYFNATIAIARKGVPYEWEAVRQLEKEWEFDHPTKSVNFSGIEFVWDGNAIAKTLMPALSGIFYKSSSCHAIQRIARTAIALRIYRRENGHYPETLNELVPKYLPNLPVDPFDGKPLRYKRLQHGFKIWSVGENMRDDGGVEVKGVRQREKGDIVWEAMK